MTKTCRTRVEDRALTAPTAAQLVSVVSPAPLPRSRLASSSGCPVCLGANKSLVGRMGTRISQALESPKINNGKFRISCPIPTQGSSSSAIPPLSLQTVPMCVWSLMASCGPDARFHTVGSRSQSINKSLRSLWMLPSPSRQTYFKFAYNDPKLFLRF